MGVHDQIFDIVFKQEEVTWKTMIFELVKHEGMNPWDIDVSLISKKYIEMLKELKQHDFRISGKVVLAAAILLKIKSKRLVGEDLNELDRLFAQSEESEEDLLFDEQEGAVAPGDPERGKAILIPRTPQPRKRKVSIYDLMGALEKALEVKHRRLLQDMPELDMQIPEKKKDISLVIRDLYFKIKNTFSKYKKLTFFQLIPQSSTKEDKITAFVPLLHLSNQRKIDLEQEEPFGDIEIILKTKKEIEGKIPKI